MHCLSAINFDGKLTWGDVGALVAALAALVGIPLIYLQVRETRRATQGEALLDLLFRLQESDTLQARSVLYGLESQGTMTDDQLLSIASQVEPILRLLDLIALLIYSKKLPREPFAEGDWAVMIARCWKAGEPIVQARRIRESRPRLWHQLERLGREATESAEA